MSKLSKTTVRSTENTARVSGQTRNSFGNPMSEKTVEIAVYTYELNQTFRNIEGKILTIVDAMSADNSQKEALKSLIRSAIWDTADRLSYDVRFEENHEIGLPPQGSGRMSDPLDR
jgi:hypothetical protein